MKRQPLDATLSQLEQQHLKRRRTTVDAFVEHGNRVMTMAGGRTLVDFSSNDYLGLAHHPAIAAAMSECAARCGAGSGASHLVTGHGVEHARLEEELAAFTGRERAVLFSTGYMANLGVITALAGRGELVLLDRLSHASLIDGALLSGARFKRYAHADVAAAERALAESSEDAAVVATDGVFSMDGDVAPLRQLARAAKAHRAWLVVDDAHGLGVLGASGRGSLEQFGLSCDDAPVLIGTLGKAFGSFGAFVAGASDLIEFLIQKARPYIYTTALPQPVAAATRKALELVQREPWRRERVLALTARFKKAAGAAAVALADSNTPIQPVVLGSSEAALLAQQELLEAGFWVVAIRPPTVPKGSERLRITLSAAHSEEQVDALVEHLSRIHVRQQAACE
ncbi:MAG: 8-amino-7-oxononanoate synthase [Gammaproteobacteria bacterium]|nr:8-amino-7-oxononanoate synthase [Gammaproteobacteria bacterium]